MAKVPSIFAYLNEGYQKYRAHKQGVRAYHRANDRLDEIRKRGELIPKDVEQIMSNAPRVGKPVSIRLRKLWDVVGRSLMNNNTYGNSYDFDRLSTYMKKNHI